MKMSEAFASKLAEHGNVWCMDQNALPRFMAEVEKVARTGGQPAKRLPRANGTVAIIPIYGVMTQRGFLGEGGTDDIGRTIDAAMANSSFSGVVLDVDSPGGSTYGLQEFADKIYGYRKADKPLVAIANSLAASAAVYAPSSSPTFVGAPGSDIGNIGVWMLHWDYSGFLEDMKIKPTFVTAGKYKVEGNPFEPLSDEGRAYWQEQVNESYSEFVATMARNRGVSQSKVKNEFGEGRVLSADKAKAVGMIDRVDTLEGVLTKMRATSVADGRLASGETELTQWLCNVWTQKPAEKPVTAKAETPVERPADAEAGATGGDAGSVELARAKRQRERRETVH